MATSFRLFLLGMLTLALACDEPANQPDGDIDGGRDSDLAADGDADGDGDVDDDGGEADGDVEAELDGDMAGDGGSDGDVAEVVLPTEANDTRLAQVVQDLSHDDMAGRLTGTPSGDMAEAAVTALLESHGFAVQTQEVVFDLYEVQSPIELSVVDEDDNATETFAYIDDYREVDFSGSGSVVGDAVFVGFGMDQGDHDSYGDFDVEGKVVVALTGVPGGHGFDLHDDGRLDFKVDEAFARGAVGVIFVPAGEDATRDEASWWEMELAATDKYLEVNMDLHHPELPVAFVHVDAVARILGTTHRALNRDTTARELGRRLRLQVTGTVHEDATCNNVFGVMEGTDPDVGDEVIILGAHYDHIGVGADGRVFNGAADNATGTGIVLETAATIAESGATPARTLVFALFCGEEQGLWGSVEYALEGTPLYPIRDTVLMIQVDNIAEEDGPYLTNGDNEPLLVDFIGGEREASELPVRYLDWGGNGASDDLPFLIRGVPAYRFISYGSYHHMAEDDFENLNLDMVSRVADVCIRGLSTIALQ